MATTIPAKHYVTIQYRKDASTEYGLLGFASPYTKDAAFEKRKVTQDHWAYGHGVKVDIDSQDTVTVLNIGSVANAKFDAGVLFMTGCYPQINSNELLEGFEVAKSVKRCGWNGGNVVWRIADPRGFELEISSANFARVLDCTTIVNGVIQGKCLWGRDGSNNILLPEASDVYQAAKVLTVKTNTKISLKDVQVGDTVEILSNKVTDEDLVCQYLGKYWLLEVSDADSAHDSTKYFGRKQTERYLVKGMSSGKYYALTTVKIVNIIDRIGTPLDKKVVSQEVSDWISLENLIADNQYTILISPTKIDLTKVVSSLEPITAPLPTDNAGNAQWPLRDKWYVDCVIVKHGGELHTP